MKPKTQAPSEPKYIDRSEVSEVFADRLEHLFFEGGVVRMEFTVIRTDPASSAPGKPIAEPKRWSYTACRVILSPRGVADMLNKMHELGGLLVREGILHPGAAVLAPAPPQDPDTAPS